MTEKDQKFFLNKSQVDPSSQTIKSLKSTALKTEPKVTKTTKIIEKPTSEKMKTIEENSPSQKGQTEEENCKVSFLKPPNLLEKNLKSPKLTEKSKKKAECSCKIS